MIDHGTIVQADNAILKSEVEQVSHQGRGESFHPTSSPRDLEPFGPVDTSLYSINTKMINYGTKIQLNNKRSPESGVEQDLKQRDG